MKVKELQRACQILVRDTDVAQVTAAECSARQLLTSLFEGLLLISVRLLVSSALLLDDVH
jgi:hypothetical protein